MAQSQGSEEGFYNVKDFGAKGDACQWPNKVSH
jgi:hypothetical protein